MIGILPRRHGIPRPGPIRATRPAVEGLEDRVLLYSTTGGQWKYPVRITYSIIPDGTSIGGIPSNLQQVLSTKSGWRQQFQKAAAVWEAVAGINLVQVTDNGSPIGTAGNQQGDPRFGDIRIGGMAQSGGQLAFAFAPPPFNGGTNAGDLFFNTSQLWQTNGTTYDLETVAIHELGHALGMGHSAIVAADMYASYGGSKQALTSDDTTGIRSVYGTRAVDPYDASQSNNSYTYATNITPYINGAGQIALPKPDITTSSDVDWYKVTAPTQTVGTMTVAMQSSNLSSLIPSVTVYNASLQVAGGSTGTNYGDTARVTVSGIQPGQVCYIKALAGTTGPGGVGADGLLVNFGSSPQSAIAPPYTVVAAQPDQNPTTTPMGTGWIINGQFTPFVPLDVLDIFLNGISLITIGTLTGYGETLAAGDLSGPSRDAGKGRGASEPHDLGSPHRQGDTSAPDGMFEAPVTPLAAGIAANSKAARSATATMFHHRLEIPRRAEVARLQAVDAALASRRHNRLLARSPSPSRPQGGDPPRCHRSIAHALGQAP